MTTSDTGCRLNCMHVCHMMEIDLHTQHGNGKWEMRGISTIYNIIYYSDIYNTPTQHIVQLRILYIPGNLYSYI